MVSDITCGPTALLGLPWPATQTLVGAWNLYVQDDLESCGTSTGTATADFF